MTDERRHHSRITFHTPAQLALPDGSVEVWVSDISLKGALVRLPANTPVQSGAACILTIRLDDLGDAIRMEAKVTHVQEAYVGIACRNIDLDSVTHLRRLVELNLGSEALLERELSALLTD